MALSLGSPPPGVTRRHAFSGARTFLQSVSVSDHPALWLDRIDGISRDAVKHLVQRAQLRQRLRIGDAIEFRRPEMQLKGADHDLGALVEKAGRVESIT